MDHIQASSRSSTNLQVSGSDLQGFFTVKVKNSCSANVAEFQRDGKLWSIKLKQVIGPITDSIPLEHSTSEHDPSKPAVSRLGTHVCLTRDGSSFRTVLHESDLV